jgi:hypothetical protein
MTDSTLRLVTTVQVASLTIKSYYQGETSHPIWFIELHFGQTMMLSLLYRRSSHSGKTCSSLNFFSSGLAPQMKQQFPIQMSSIKRYKAPSVARAIGCKSDIRSREDRNTPQHTLRAKERILCSCRLHRSLRGQDEPATSWRREIAASAPTWPLARVSALRNGRRGPVPETRLSMLRKTVLSGKSTELQRKMPRRERIWPRLVEASPELDRKIGPISNF